MNKSPVKIRLIPILLLREGTLVKSYEFKRFLPTGNPLTAIQFFNTWAVDEIVFLDITPDRPYTTMRLDNNLKEFKSLPDYTAYISKHCFVPLTVGGGVKTLADMHVLFSAGADKVALNTILYHNPRVVSEAAAAFGSQALVASIDVKINPQGKYEVVTAYGKEFTAKDPVVWAKEVEKLGVGEILLNSIDRDGTMSGYDLGLIRQVADKVSIPVIACGGVGKWQHLVDGVTKGHATAVAAANIFHFTEQSTKKAKDYMFKKGLNVRQVSFVHL